MTNHELGRKSEELACAFLVARGWQILARNYRAGHKEIDIIARSDHTVAFIEVKARGGSGWGHPLDAITWSKRRELAAAARAWLRANHEPLTEYRFDAIAISWRAGAPHLEHVPNAWLLSR